MTARRPRDGRAPNRPPVGLTPVTPTGGPSSIGVAMEAGGRAIVVLIEHDGQTTTGALTWDQALSMVRALIQGSAVAASNTGVSPDDFTDAVINVIRSVRDWFAA